jgi:hypothetical protein
MLQKIVVYLNLDKWDTSLIVHGVRLAAGFEKELCLFYQVSAEYDPGVIDEKLKFYRDEIKKRFPHLPVSILLGPFRKGEMALLLADEHEAIMLVAATYAFSKLANALQNSPIPFLFVDNQVNSSPDFSKIVFPVDIRRQNRDALKWILYFGKYHHSEIIAIGANDKFASNKKMVTGHLTSLKNMLVKYNVSHKIYRGSMNSLHIHNEGLETAIQLHAGLLVLLGSSVITLLDLLIGLPEKKIISRAKNMSVLVINPRKETYLVCE